MKKYLAIFLALVLCLSLGVTAFAADEAPSVKPADVTVIKAYDLGDGTAAPEETLSFEVEYISGVAGGYSGALTIGSDENTFETTGAAELDMTLTFPTFTKVGVYKWEITETAGETQGVEYDDASITVVVTVTNSASGDGSADTLAATVAIHKSAADETSEENKLGEGDAAFENTYGQGGLKVTKVVSGNLASNSKLFTFHITFTSKDEVGSDITYTVAGGEKQTLAFTGKTATVDIELSNDQTAEFSNIPAGVEYAVVEDTKHAEGADSPETTEEGYTIKYDGKEEGKIEKDKVAETTVTNEKKTEVDTGVILDSLPYVLVVAVVLSAAALMFINKRRSEV